MECAGHLEVGDLVASNPPSILVKDQIAVHKHANDFLEEERVALGLVEDHCPEVHRQGFNRKQVRHEGPTVLTVEWGEADFREALAEFSARLLEDRPPVRRPVWPRDKDAEDRHGRHPCDLCCEDVGR